MDERNNIKGFVESLNEVLEDTYIHTFQFVSIDKNNENNVIWRMLSLDINEYENVVKEFTGTSVGEYNWSIKRTLIYSDYNGPAWFHELGKDKIQKNQTEYYYKVYPNTIAMPKDQYDNIAPKDYSNDVHGLLKYWGHCLENTFGYKGSAMWISQKHTTAEGYYIASSIFILFNGSPSEEVKETVATRSRDYIIEYLINVYKERAIRAYKTQEDAFLQLVEDKKSNYYLSDTLIMNLKRMSPVIKSDLPIMISGETGTGKSILSKHIHDLSHRKKEKFETINCSGYSNCPELLEELFFGNVKQGKEGFIKSCSKGTVFIDDIQSLALHLQLKFKEYLESNAVSEHNNDKSNVRLIFASYEYLLEDVTNGSFIEDLYYRINIINFHLPPLRERKQEITELSQTFIAEFNKNYKYDNVKQLSEDAYHKLTEYDYPGNIRELYNVLLRSYMFSNDAELIESKHIQY